LALDLALRLWRQGYDAIPSARGWPVGRDAFVTRLLGRPALVVRGPDGARLFYDADRVRREKAAPAALAAAAGPSTASTVASTPSARRS